MAGQIRTSSIAGYGADPPAIDRTEATLLEMRLVGLCARAVLSPADHSRLQDVLDSGVDWDTVVALARRHRLLPLVGSHLRAYKEFVPAQTRQDLSRSRFDNAVWALNRTAQLIEILDAFDSADVSAVPYKGPVLGTQLYGSGALRIFSDLDIIVRPRDVSRARRVLIGLGYEPRAPITDVEVEFMVRHRYHEAFVRGAHGPVELHWSFTNREIAFAIDLDEAWTRLRSVELHGRTVPTLHPEDLLLILSVHGAKHRWDRLEWLAGLAELIRQSEEMRWESVLARAKKLGVRRTLSLGLLLAVDLLEAPVPEPVVHRIRADRRLPPLVEQVREVLREPPAGWELENRIRRDRFRILLQERFRDRLRFVWNRATTPSDPHRWEVARIGPWLFPVHSFRRPFHFLGLLLSSESTTSARPDD